MTKRKKDNVVPVQDADNTPKAAKEQKESEKVTAPRRKSANEQRAEEIFSTHNAGELYFTSDGSAFLDLNYARIHARTLKEQNIETIEKKK